MIKRSNNERNNSNMEKVWDKYCSTAFSAANKLDQEDVEEKLQKFDTQDNRN